MEQLIPVPNPLVVLREEFDDWAVLFDPDTAEALGINPIGVFIWKLMDGRIGIEDIVLEVGRVFVDVPDTASEEISAFIEELYKKGVVGYNIKE